MCDHKNGGDHDEDVDELSASDESEPEERLSSVAFVPELDEDDDDDDREAVTSAPAAEAQSPFSLRGGGTAFSDRSHSIFDCLDSVPRLTSSSSSQKQENITDGVFARPLPPPPSRKTSQPQSSCPTPAKKKGAPDYLLHPERWTHYSLENVSETSDQGNSRAALQYLSSLQQRKEQQESPGDSCNTQHKMIFRPSRSQNEQPADQSSAVRSREKETRLSHLEEEEDEEEEGREEPHAGGRRTDQSVEKAEDIDRRGAVGRSEETKPVEKEKVDEEQKVEEANRSFTSFRKIKHKNYRKSSGQEDN